jgi:outer membrane lipoprotein-sorting protein
MNRFLKNRLLVILFVILLSIALAGCGGSAPEESPEDQEDDPSASEEEEVSAEELLAKGMSVEGFSYDYVLTMPNGEEITHKMWVKGDNMRSEMENPAGGEPILSIMNMDEGFMYVYHPEVNYAVQMPLDQSDMDTTSPQDYIIESDADTMLFTKRETFDGKECLVYETDYEGGKDKMWIWEEGGMPLRIETTSGSDTVVVEFLNFTIGNVEDAMFQLPPGAEIMDVGNM